jgi:hypothetical protein
MAPKPTSIIEGLDSPPERDSPRTATLGAGNPSRASERPRHASRI